MLKFIKNYLEYKKIKENASVFCFMQSYQSLFYGIQNRFINNFLCDMFKINTTNDAYKYFIQNYQNQFRVYLDEYSEQKELREEYFNKNWMNCTMTIDDNESYDFKVKIVNNGIDRIYKHNDYTTIVHTSNNFMLTIPNKEENDSYFESRWLKRR